MQQRPDPGALLDAVAQFLLTEIQPALSDKRLAFRALIAANLVNIVSCEGKAGPAQQLAELSRLRQLMPDAASDDPNAPGAAERTAALQKLNALFCRRLRERTLAADDPAVRAHVRQSLIEALATANPRFELADDIE